MSQVQIRGEGEGGYNMSVSSANQGGREGYNMSFSSANQGGRGGGV